MLIKGLKTSTSAIFVNKSDNISINIRMKLPDHENYVRNNCTALTIEEKIQPFSICQILEYRIEFTKFFKC